MVEFFEKTWFIWWLFGIVVIVRWFQIVSCGPEIESAEHHGEDSVHPQFSSLNS